MVRHEAVGPDVQTEARTLVGELLQIRSVIVVRKEDGLPSVAALSDMVRQAGYGDAGESGHDLSSVRNSV